MKRLLILSIIGVLGLNMIGCSSNKKINPIDDPNKIILQEKIDATYKDSIELIREVFKKHNIKMKSKKDESNIQNQKGITWLEYNSDKREINKVYNATYKKVFDKNGDISVIHCEAYLTIDAEQLKEKGFNFRETIFGELFQVFSPSSEKDFAINKLINNYYEGRKDGYNGYGEFVINDKLSVIVQAVKAEINFKFNVYADEMRGIGDLEPKYEEEKKEETNNIVAEENKENVEKENSAEAKQENNTEVEKENNIEAKQENTSSN